MDRAEDLDHFYFSNNREMLNTEQIKMPQSKLQKNRFLSTSCSTFPLLPAVFCLCSFSPSAASASLGQRVQKFNRKTVHIPASSRSWDLEASHIKPGSRQACFNAEANPDLFTVYQGTLVGMNDWKNEWMNGWMDRGCAEGSLNLNHVRKAVVTDDYKGKSNSFVHNVKNAKIIWCSQLSLSPPMFAAFQKIEANEMRPQTAS